MFYNKFFFSWFCEDNVIKIPYSTPLPTVQHIIIKLWNILISVSLTTIYTECTREKFKSKFILLFYVIIKPKSSQKTVHLLVAFGLDWLCLYTERACLIKEWLNLYLPRAVRKISEASSLLWLISAHLRQFTLETESNCSPSFFR